MSYEPSVKLCQTLRPEIVTIKLTRNEKLALRDMSEKERKRKKYWENVEETRQNSKQYDDANRERVRELTRERVKRHRAKKAAEQM